MTSDPAAPTDRPDRGDHGGAPTTTVHLVRHGESVWNRHHRVQGQTAQVPLTPLGHRQAEAAAASLAHRPVRALVTSDLLRTRQTAEHLAARLGLAPLVDPAFREQDLGRLQGCHLEGPLGAGTVAEEIQRLWLEPGAAPPFGESLVRLVDRTAAALADLAARHDGGEVVVVTHGGPIRVARALADDPCASYVPRIPIANGSIHSLRVPVPAGPPGDTGSGGGPGRPRGTRPTSLVGLTRAPGPPRCPG
jgi:probable phosphoglycerate mutase